MTVSSVADQGRGHGEASRFFFEKFPFRRGRPPFPPKTSPFIQKIDLFGYEWGSAWPLATLVSACGFLRPVRNISLTNKTRF